MKALVTGGAGFIGSHLVDYLISQGKKVIVFDDFSTGSALNLDYSRVEKVIVGNLLTEINTLRQAVSEVDTVYHLAANADIRGGINNHQVDIDQNIIGTYNVLEACYLGDVKRIIFTSSAAVYGEPDIIPTPETYAPTQTSLYGASKLAAEALIQAYSEYYGIQSFIFRFVSFVGERYSHGVVYDFVNKLLCDPTYLDILGDGLQEKSYLYVKDGIEAMMRCVNQLSELKNIINVGHFESLSVKDLASVVIDEMRLSDVNIVYKGGSRGWVGDSPKVKLDLQKLQSLGFQPTVTIEEGIRKTVRYLLA